MVQETRSDRYEALIERTLDIAADLKSIVAVHEQRLMTQDKALDGIAVTIETNRKDAQADLHEVYEMLDKQDAEVLEEIKKNRAETATALKEVNNKLTSLQKYVWMCLGGFAVIQFIIANYSWIAKIVGMVAK